MRISHGCAVPWRGGGLCALSQTPRGAHTDSSPAVGNTGLQSTEAGTCAHWASWWFLTSAGTFRRFEGGPYPKDCGSCGAFKFIKYRTPSIMEGGGAERNTEKWLTLTSLLQSVRRPHRTYNEQKNTRHSLLLICSVLTRWASAVGRFLILRT